MSSAFHLQHARDALLQVAGTVGARHEAGCAALLEMLSAGEQLHEALRQELARLGLSVAGFGILTQLRCDRPAPLGTGDLARLLHLPAQAVSEALTRLELSAFIARERDPAHRRRNIVTLTPAGRRAIDDVLRRFDTVIHRSMQELSSTDLQILQRACTCLADTAKSNAPSS